MPWRWRRNQETFILIRFGTGCRDNSIWTFTHTPAQPPEAGHGHLCREGCLTLTIRRVCCSHCRRSDFASVTPCVSDWNGFLTCKTRTAVGLHSVAAGGNCHLIEVVAISRLMRCAQFTVLTP